MRVVAFALVVAWLSLGVLGNRSMLASAQDDPRSKLTYEQLLRDALTGIPGGYYRDGKVTRIGGFAPGPEDADWLVRSVREKHPIGRHAERAKPDLLAALKDPSKLHLESRIRCVNILASFDDPALAEEFRALLSKQPEPAAYATALIRAYAQLKPNGGQEFLRSLLGTGTIQTKQILLGLALFGSEASRREYLQLIAQEFSYVRQGKEEEHKKTLGTLGLREIETGEAIQDLLSLTFLGDAGVLGVFAKALCGHTAEEVRYLAHAQLLYSVQRDQRPDLTLVMDSQHGLIASWDKLFVVWSAWCGEYKNNLRWDKEHVRFALKE